MNSQPHQPKITSEKIRKSIIIYSGLCVLVSSLLVSFVTLVPLVKYLKKTEELNFIEQTTCNSFAIEGYFSKINQIALQTSYKTGIRTKLKDFAAGAIDKDALQKFIEPKLANAIRLSPDLIGIQILNPSGQEIIVKGSPTPKGFFTPDHKNINEQPSLDYLHIEDDLYIVIFTIIYDRDSSKVAYSLCLFSTEPIAKILQQKNTTAHESYATGIARGEKLEILLPTLKNRAQPEDANDFLWVDNVSPNELEKPKGFLSNTTQEKQHNHLTAFNRIAGTDWILFHRIGESTFYTQMYQRVSFVVGTLAGMILLAIFGVFLLLRPLTGRVLIYSSELEELNRDLQQRIQKQQKTEGQLNLVLSETQEARDKIDAILKSVTEGMIVINLENRVVLINQVAEAWLGVTASTAISQPIDMLLPDNAIPKRFFAALQSKVIAPTLEWELQEAATGKIRNVQAHIAPVKNIAGNPTGKTILLRDVTKDRNLDRMKSEFISTAAHELRTPLTTVLGYSELLLNQKEYSELSPDQKNCFLQEINQKAQQLSAIISDLLDLSDLDAGRSLILEKESHDLGALTTQTAAEFQQKPAGHIFSLELPEQPVEIQVDSDKIQQVLKNLISNAIKFSPKGTLISIRGLISGSSFVMTVQDEGIGMEREEIANIFNKFYRVDGSNTAAPGLGLGMSIVQTIIAAHGGEIWVTSEKGKGTTVSFTLPFPDPAA